MIVMLTMPQRSLAIELTLTPNSAVPGTTVTFTGDFGPYVGQANPKSIVSACTLSVIRYGDSNPVTTMGYHFTSCDWAFNGALSISNDAKLGEYDITISATIDGKPYPEFPFQYSPSAQLTVAPMIKLTPTSGPVGTTVTVSGIFGGSIEYVTIYGIGQPTQTCPVSGGKFSCTFIVGNVEPNFYPVYVVSIWSNQISATFTVTSGTPQLQTQQTTSPIISNSTITALAAILLSQPFALIGVILIIGIILVVHNVASNRDGKSELAIKSTRKPKTSIANSCPCPSCGVPVAYYAKSCTKCNVQLEWE